MSARLSSRDLLLAAAIIIASPPAFACMGPDSETSTLLPRLPAAAYQQDVVARVEILELIRLSSPWRKSERAFTPLARARVLRGFKGIKATQEIIIDTGGTDCDQMFVQSDVGTRVYLAGQVSRNPQGATVFRGRWRNERTRGGIIEWFIYSVLPLWR